MLTSSLKQLWDFTDFFSNQIVPKLDTSTFWALVALTIKVGVDPTWGLHALRLTLRISLLKTKETPWAAYLECSLAYAITSRDLTTIAVIRQH